MFQPSQYQKVSLNSDSEDDEDVLYAATPLNNNGDDPDHTFGLGVYNRDLRLNLSSPGYLEVKSASKYKEKQNMIYAGLCCAALVVIVLGLATTVVVYAQVYLPNDPSNNTMCVTPPPPLAGTADGCQEKKRPSPVPPVNTHGKTVPTTVSTQPSDETSPTSQASDETSPTSQASDETSPTSQASDETSSTSQPSDETSPTSQASDETSPTSQPGDETSQPGDKTSPTSHASDGTTQSSVKTEPPSLILTNEQASPSTSQPTVQLEERTKLPKRPTEAHSEHTELPTWQLMESTKPPRQSTTASPEAPPSPTQYQVPTEPSKPQSSTTSSTLHTSTPSQGSIDWRRELFPSATELSLQLFDMNRDGIQDVLMSKMSDPCMTELLAFDGLSGEVVWQAKVNFPVFSLRCVLDVNQDNVTDCLASGRFGGFTALNGIDGSILWVVDRTITFPRYNFYFPLIVSDLDFDGVPDIINTHGGDTQYPPWEKNRTPGFLVVISGRTGRKLLDRIMIPDGHETYCSPVLYDYGGTELILFGSGGETISGSLWAVSWHSIRVQVSRAKSDEQYKVETDDAFHSCFMNSNEVTGLRPSFDVAIFDQSFDDAEEHADNLRKCPKIGKHDLIWNAYDLCMYEILRSPDKGVLLPPLILDLNADAVDDLLVSTFTGHVYAFDGRDLDSLLWEVYYPDTESYSLPTPLFYNEDFFPDLLLRANLGEWGNYYNSSTLRIVDGHTGDIRWSLDTVHMAMNSGISLAADSHGQDAMLFFAIGETEHQRVRRHGDMSDDMEAPPVPENLWVSTPDDPFPDPDEDLDGFLRYCGHSLREVSVYVYLVTHEMVESGEELKPIAIESPFVFRGQYDISAMSAANISMNFKRQADQLFNTPPPFHSSDANMFGEAPEDSETNNFPPNNFNPQNVDDGSDSTSHQQPNNGPPPPPNSNYDPQMDPDGKYNFQDEDFDPTDKKKFRCAYILVPTNDAATPAIGDVNGDGKLELSYTVGWEVVPDSEAYIGMTPLKMAVRTFTIEEEFSKVYGEGKLDFSRFLPPDKQPWTKYMGQTGDNVYHPQHTLRDN